jgi:hypothetical protein
MFSLLKYNMLSHICLRVSIFFIFSLPQICCIKEWIVLDSGGRVTASGKNLGLPITPMGYVTVILF